MSTHDALKEKRKAVKGIGRAVLFHRDYHRPILVEEMSEFKRCEAYPCRLINEGPEIDTVLEGEYLG